MIKIKDLIPILGSLPDDCICYAYDGEVTGIVIWNKEGKELGYIPCNEFKEAGITFEAMMKKAERLRVRFKPEFILKREIGGGDAGEANKIVHLTTDKDKVRIIPVGDIHVGAPENLCDWPKLIGTLKYIEDTPDTYMIGMGDYGDFATKMSRGPSVYQQTLSPQQQYEAILNAFRPLALKNK